MREHERIIKFLVVGALGVVINTSLLYLLTEYAHLFYLLSSTIAIEISILSNFVWNNLWTFSDAKKKPLINKFIAFQSIAVCGIIIYTLLLYVFTDIFQFYYILSSLLTIPITVSWNYLMNKYITWNSQL